MRPRNRTRSRAPHLARRLPLIAAALAALLGTSSCDDGMSSPGRGTTISAETFIDVMVALRTSPLLDSSGYLPPGASERILAEHGVSPDDMRGFVEVHGTDVPLMTDIWSAIDARIAEAGRTTSPES